MKQVLPFLIFCCLAARLPAQGLDSMVKDNVLQLPAPVIFQKNLAVLDSTCLPTLHYIRYYLITHQYYSTVRIECYTDSTLPPKQALNLSKSRARALADWLVRNGVECAQLLPVGFGSDNDIHGVELTRIVNAGLRGKPIGGKPLDGGGYPAGNPCEY